jgi:sugar phosphate isomerase/epimerase
MDAQKSNETSRQMLWSATLGQAPLPDRIEAAAVNRYSGVTVRVTDLDYLAAEDYDVGALCANARDRGVEPLMLESFSSWYDHEPPPKWFPPTTYTLDDHLKAAETFGSTDLTITAPFRTTTETTDSLTERFAVVCDRCADAGIAVHLEFVPFPPISSLAIAWDIVRGAARRNGGILFDTWHFFRGEPDLDLLATIPGDHIFSVQVSDGSTELQESLVKDTFRHRRLPGDGVFDLVGVLRTLRSTGGLRLVGPEVLSIELDALPPVEAARLAGEALDRLVAAL